MLSNKLKPERGAVLVFAAVFFFVVLVFLALSIGTGFVATQSTRLQTVANVGAMAALDFYISNPNDPNRQTTARDRANQVIDANDISGVELALGEVGLAGSPGEAGELIFGTYLREPPGTGSTNCTLYPCFEEQDPGNSVLLRLRTQDDNQLSAPFTKLLGQEKFSLESETVTTIVNTCVLHALDVSVSTVNSNYLLYPSYPTSDPSQFAVTCDPGTLLPANYQDPPVVAPAVPDPFNLIGIDRDYPLDCYFRLPASATYPLTSLFAYRSFGVLDPASGTPWLRINPAGEPESVSVLIPAPDEVPSGFQPNHIIPDYDYWANMADSRDEEPNPSGFQSFKSDYVLRRVNRGVFVPPDLETPPGVSSNEMLINKFRRPSPLQEFMLGANIVLRTIEQLPSTSNRGGFWAFTGDVFNRLFPPPLPPDDPNCPNCPVLTDNLRFLTQLTNMDLIGGVQGTINPATGYGVPDPAQPETVPNMLDYGFFPMASGQGVGSGADPAESASNIALVLFNAAGTLSRECGGEARRQIYLYTDMLPTCLFNPGGAGFSATYNPSCALGDPDGPLNPLPPSPYANYAYSEYFILTELIPFLQAAGISVNIFFDGQGVRPHIRNVLDPEYDGVGTCPGNNDPECFLDFERAPSRNYGGILGSNNVPDWVGQGLPATWDPGADLYPPCGVDPSGGTFNSLFECAGENVNGPASDRDAFDFLLRGDPQAIFPRAQALAYELSAQTGGLFCPLLNVPVDAFGAPDSTDYIDHDSDMGTFSCQDIYDAVPGTEQMTPCILAPASRIVGEAEERALEFLPKVRQAARCAQQVAGSNPFVQEIPLQICDTAGNCEEPF